jgi:hypothetical protein
MNARKLVLAVLCVAVGGLVFASAPALAASPPVVGEESVADVSSSSASFLAQVDPEGSGTTYRFEYDTSAYTSEATHGERAPSPEGSAGEGTSPVIVEAHVQGLLPGTAYHYRVVATNAAHETVDGEDEKFTTQTAGEGLVLPDGRQWEMVSPLDKEGGLILPIGEAGLIQAAADGGAITYQASNPTEENPPGNPLGGQVLSARGAEGGWSSRDLATPHNTAPGTVVGNGGEYRFFSADLSLSLVEPFGEGETPLSTKATERTGYLRDDAPVQPGAGEQALYGEAEAEAPGSNEVGYLPLVTPANVPPGTKFGAKFPGGVRFEGATPDLSHVVLESETAALTSKAAEAGLERGLYEWSGGQLQLVSVLPGAAEEPVGGEFASGFFANDGSARNAISNDGSRIVWGYEGHLYLRDTVAGETVQVDAAQGTTEPERGDAEFQLASSEGSKVFFTDQEKLTTASTEFSRDLYECEVIEVAGKLKCNLSDLTVDPNAGERSTVQGLLLGASEDGSYVYFVASGVLGDGAEHGATPGIEGCSSTCNLYVLHESGGKWTTRFIATLLGGDSPDWSNSPGRMPARVSPDGRYLAFMSKNSLTGYDNTDANEATGKHADEEVYLYHAEKSESGELERGHLICASCDPSGARPVGIEANEDTELIDEDRVWSGPTWLAADVPGWTGVNINKARYQPRYLSDSGRLFFNSVDALVPQASNGVADVYEYEPAGVSEPAGVPGCSSSSVTFGEASGGCVALVSGASSGEESVFLDASENGEDVFFLTTAGLAPQDLDNAYDVYDAHVCSASVPCPAVTVSSRPCVTADSCRAAPTPQPSLFGAPSSATFSGAGNAASASAPAKTVKAKAKTAVQIRAGKLAKALKACKAKSKSKRKSCEAQARKRYGAKAKKSATSTRRGR